MMRRRTPSQNISDGLSRVGLSLVDTNSLPHTFHHYAYPPRRKTTRQRAPLVAAPHNLRAGTRVQVRGGNTYIGQSGVVASDSYGSVQVKFDGYSKTVSIDRNRLVAFPREHSTKVRTETSAKVSRARARVVTAMSYEDHNDPVEFDGRTVIRHFSKKRKRGAYWT